MRRLWPLLLLCVLPVAGAQTYRWVDPASGKTVVSDSPPPGNARQTSVSKEAARPDDGLPYATRLAAERFPVVLYTASECGGCEKAKALLGARRIPFTEKSAQDPAIREELSQLLGGGDVSVPVLKVGRQVQRGFEAGAYEQALDLAGYPGRAAPTTENP